MKVISFSIFDTKHDWQFLFYIRGLFFNVAMAEIVYPGWCVSVAVERTVYIKYKEFFKELAAVVYVYDEEPLCKMMLWRMKPVFDENVTYLICRDADALVTFREAQSVRRWTDSFHGAAHSIHDNQAHSGQLMGGLCGFKCDRLRDMYGSYSAMLAKSEVVIADHGTDQYFLNSVIYRDFEREYVFDDKPVYSRSDPRWLSNLCISFIGAAGCNEMETLRYLRSQGTDLSLNGVGKLYPQIFYWL